MNSYGRKLKRTSLTTQWLKVWGMQLYGSYKVPEPSTAECPVDAQLVNTKSDCYPVIPCCSDMCYMHPQLTLSLQE